MTPDALPPEAVTAAGNALRQQWLTDRPGMYHVDLDPMHWAAVALEAAAPHLAAAEREACAQLAEQHHAHYGCYVAINGKQTSGLRPFADLLRGAGEAPKEDHHD